MPRLAVTRVDADRYDGDPADDGVRPAPATDAGLLSAHTAAGTCHIHPGNHGETTTVPAAIVREVDGVVLEEAATPYERLELDDFRAVEQYAAALGTALDGERPTVYAVDVPLAGGVEAYHERGLDTFLELVLVAGGLAVLGIVGLLLGVVLAPLLCVPLLVLLLVGYLPPGVVSRPGRLGGALRRTIAYAQLVNGYSAAAARSAAVAETLDAHLLPYLRAEHGRRPELFVDYGAAHLDIYAYLRHPRLRRAVLRCYRLHNLTDRDWSYLDAALAFEFDDLTGWNDTETADGIRHKRVLLRFESDGE